MASSVGAHGGVGAALWFALVAWRPVISAWLARGVPGRMRSGGGLLFACFQLAITVGAAVGGLIVDSIGVTPALAATEAGEYAVPHGTHPGH